jgi:hypothetical protein
LAFSNNFTANLSKSLAKERTDTELLEKLREVFDAYGECWVIIRRNAEKNNIPFAFVQYKVCSKVLQLAEMC